MVPRTPTPQHIHAGGGGIQGYGGTQRHSTHSRLVTVTLTNKK